MKKLTLLLLIALSGCGPVMYENYQPHRHGIQGTPRYGAKEPKYGAKDTVYNFRNDYVL